MLCLRFFTAYGPRQRPDLAIHKFARLMTEGSPVPRFGDGTTERDYTYVDDIVDGVMGSLDYLEAYPGSYEIVNLGESRTISLNEMIDTVSRALAVKPVVDELPLQPGDVTRTYADVSKARALLKYVPRTGFQEGVRRVVEWFREDD